MNYYNGQNNPYPRRSTARAKEPEVPAIGKRLVEAFMTQLTICTLVAVTIFAAHRLEVPGVDQSLNKVKTIITYSPSLKEIAKETTEGVMTLIGRMNAQGQAVDDDYMPVIIVDDEIF